MWNYLLALWGNFSGHGTYLPVVAAVCVRARFCAIRSHRHEKSDLDTHAETTTMSPLFLIPYLLFFLYQSYVALKKRAEVSKRAAHPNDKEKDSLAVAEAGTSSAVHVDIGVATPTSVRNLYVTQVNPRPTANDPSFDDRDDYADADRGFIAALEPGIIKTADGKGVAWDVDQFSFLNQDPAALPTIHPHLVRQGQLNIKQGLYQVATGVYQVRALDVSNMTILEGDTGIVVIDPLVSIECARAAVELYYAHRGRRSVTGLVFSHSHVDHCMGATGVLPPGQGDVSTIPIIAPHGFLEATVKENVLVGPAMLKRGLSMFGTVLPINQRG